MATIAWLKDIKKDDVGIVGGKGANLGEMFNAGFPVPEAFIVTADAFLRFISEKNLKGRIFSMLERVDVNNEEMLEEVYEKIKDMFNSEKMPPDMEADIVEAYNALCGGDCFVAVRSSATAEDLPEASFAGQQETFLNVRGKVDVLNAIKMCWASLYTPRAIFYRVSHGFDHKDVLIAVVVQRMVDANVAGVMMTSDPTTGEKRVIIEAAFGLGESVVGGKVTPDTYIVSHDLNILDKHIGKQAWMLVRKNGKNVRVDLDEEVGGRQKLDDNIILELAKIGLEIEKYYGKPMDVEWCVEDGKIYIVQARDITTIGKGQKGEGDVEGGAGNILVKGLPASPGVGKGRVVKIKDASELDRVKDGDVLVTTMTSPDMVPAMRRAAAIVTDEGGMTCHAAIVSRELGIPCIVGTGNATQVLANGGVVTVDAIHGVVYEGDVEIRAEVEKKEGTFAGEYAPVTATKILLNLGVPDKAEEYASLPVDGVGLMREEFIVSSYVGEHPLALIEKGEEEKFVDALAEGIAKVARAFYPRPVVIRTSDFKTNEYRA